MSITKMGKVTKPLKYTPEQIEKALAKYFREVKEEGRPITVSGIAMALDTNRQTLINYEDRAEQAQEELKVLEANPEDTEEYRKQLEELRETVEYFGKIFVALSRAKMKAQLFAEESLFQPKIANGVIFSLKNNWGWTDRREVEQSGNITVNNATYKADDPK